MARNRNKKKKIHNTQGRSLKAKVPVFGMLCDGLVYVKVVDSTGSNTLMPIIREKVKSGCVVVTDGWKAYRKLEKDYQHKVINHSMGIYKTGLTIPMELKASGAS